MCARGGPAKGLAPVPPLPGPVGRECLGHMSRPPARSGRPAPVVPVARCLRHGLPTRPAPLARCAACAHGSEGSRGAATPCARPRAINPGRAPWGSPGCCPSRRRARAMRAPTARGPRGHHESPAPQPAARSAAAAGPRPGTCQPARALSRLAEVGTCGPEWGPGHPCPGHCPVSPRASSRPAVGCGGSDPAAGRVTPGTWTPGRSVLGGTE